MRAVELAGGIPGVLPPLGHDAIAPLLDRLCGVCLSGGHDIDPHGYGEAPHPRLGPTEPDRDAFELAVEGDGPALYLGVQWHAESPVERDEHLALFRAVVEESDRFGARDVTARAA
jgi:gamma-glutamyl-gamma-aminobutyrate hydrolase PuuD